jgi:hypothetical protein
MFAILQLQTGQTPGTWVCFDAFFYSLNERPSQNYVVLSMEKGVC